MTTHRHSPKSLRDAAWWGAALTLWVLMGVLIGTTFMAVVV